MPEILQFFKPFPHHFILYQTVPSASRAGKTDKFPCDHRTGNRINAHDPQYWTDAATAEATAAKWGQPWGVGFVFTEADPFFFIDIDNCLTPQGWSPLAQSICQLFAGAAIEISQSGTGLHIFGTGKPPAHSCRNQALGLEFYTSGRFVALTGTNAVGDAATDCTHALRLLVAAYFPPDAAAAHDGEAWSDSPVTEWSGPADDGELIRRMMLSKSAAATFGGKASFADLWMANADALGRAHPDLGGRAYDASATDAALAQHLAWWTGKDCQRIERIMRMSALARDKWERADYLQRTILGAVTRQENVHGEGTSAQSEAAKRRHDQLSENLRIGEGTEEYPSSIVHTEDEMLARYVNIIEGKRVIDLEHPRRIFGLDEWKSAHKSSRSELVDKKGFNPDGTSKTKQVETSKLWEMNPARRQVDAVTFRPGFMPVTLDPEGKSAANTWRPITRSANAGDASLFLQHIDYLFGSDAPRFIDWLAHIEQRPGELPHTGWVHISPSQGTGRNWLASVLCRLWGGYVASSFDLAGTLRTGFNGPLSQKLLAVVDEINEGGTDGRWENAETLKSLVTSEHRHINPKYGHQRLEYNACRWLIFSNHTSALPLTERDRRFNIVRNENPPMASEYYGRLYATLKSPEFISGVAELLRNRDISDFNPGAHAIMNEAKREMVAASRSDADEIVAHLVTSHPADVIANTTLGTILTNHVSGKMTPHHRHALERAGVRPWGNAIRVAGIGVSKVSILRNHSVWKDAEAWQIQVELQKSTVRASGF
jgi:primase-polymerase (primpol)-like protein